MGKEVSDFTVQKVQLGQISLMKRLIVLGLMGWFQELLLALDGPILAGNLVVGKAS
jgi:hypothetical protein